MPFLNRIRLPLYLKTPQFPTEANRFRLSNGESKTLSVTIRKNYNLVTDYMSQTMHQRLVIALNHDNVSIEGDRYVGGVTVDGEYEIAWPDFLDYPLGQAAVKLQITPFDMTNDNCRTCDEMTQLALVDDDAGEIDEGATAEVQVFANDSICCFPVVAEIVSFNTAYLDDATIDGATGVVTLTVKDPVASVGSIVMATYRVTCPDGSYDEADVYASINGSGDACEQPGDFGLPVFTDDPLGVIIDWATPGAVPVGGFQWELYRVDTPGTPVATGTETDHDAEISGIDPSTDYAFYVRSICEDGIMSPYTQFLFTTPASGSDTCGTFNVAANDGTVNLSFYNYSFMDCDGNVQNKTLLNLSSRQECMLTDTFNVPIYFESDPAVTILYDSPC